MHRFFWLSFSAILGASTMRAQGLRFQVLAGAGMNGAIAQSGPTNYHAIVLPRICAGVRVPLTEKVALLSGVDLLQKGFRSQRTRFDTSVRTKTAMNSTSRYSQLNIPLQVSVCLLRRDRFALEINGGMSYGFMIAARSAWSYSTYYPGGNRDDYGSEVEPGISLLPYDNRLATSSTANYGALYLFNPAFTGSVTLQLRRHLLLQLYGEYNLYDAASVSYDAPVNLYSAGACLGYRF